MKSTQDDFIKLYKEKYKVVFARVFNQIKDRCDAEDLTADIFVKISNKVESINKGALNVYLYHTTSTSIIDYHRKQSRRSDMVEINDNIMNSYLPCDCDIIPLLNKNIDVIGADNLNIFMLKAYYGYNNMEIAKMLDINSNVVKNRIEKTKNNIKTKVLSNLDNSLLNTRLKEVCC